MSHFEEPDDGLRDDEYPDEMDDYDDDEVDTIRCRNCGADVYEESEQCPECGEYMFRDTHPLAGRSWIFIVLGVLGILSVIFLMLLG